MVQTGVKFSGLVLVMPRQFFFNKANVQKLAATALDIFTEIEKFRAQFSFFLRYCSCCLSFSSSQERSLWPNVLFSVLTLDHLAAEGGLAGTKINIVSGRVEGEKASGRPDGGQKGVNVSACVFLHTCM